MVLAAEQAFGEQLTLILGPERLDVAQGHFGKTAPPVLREGNLDLRLGQVSERSAARYFSRLGHPTARAPVDCSERNVLQPVGTQGSGVVVPFDRERRQFAGAKRDPEHIARPIPFGVGGGDFKLNPDAVVGGALPTRLPVDFADLSNDFGRADRPLPPSSLNHGNKVERTIHWFKHHLDPPRCRPPPVASLVMRVALVCPYSCTVPGGVQTQVLGLARALGARGDSVAVIAPADGVGIPGVGVPGGAIAAGLDAGALGGAAFFKVGGGIPISVNGSRAPVSPWPATMARTRAALRRFAPSVVHIHEPFVPGPSLAAVWFGPHPILGTFHRAGADAAYRAYGHFAGAWAGRLDAVFAVSEEARATAQACIARLTGSIGIIPNGVELDRFASVDPWPSNVPAVAFVGRIEPRKGLDVLLEAFALLSGSAHLWVMGDGPDRQRLQGRFSDPRIEWLGPVADDERAARLAGASVFVAPSCWGEVFRDRAARGDGGRNRGRRVGPARLPAREPREPLVSCPGPAGRAR